MKVFAQESRSDNQNLDHRAAFIGFSPRSGRQHKAWGVSPRIKERKWRGPAKRAIAVAVGAIQIIRLPPAPRAWFNLPARSWGSRPRLYADVRSADSEDQTRPLSRKILPKAYSAESSMLLPSQSLALGLTLIAAPQLSCMFTS